MDAEVETSRQVILDTVEGGEAVHKAEAPEARFTLDQSKKIGLAAVSP